MSRILVTGSNSGLGAAICSALAVNHEVIPYDLPERDVLRPSRPFEGYGLDILINCAGVNRLDWLENFEENQWDRVMDVNAKGIYLMSRYFLGDLHRSKGTILNIISDAAHKPMNCSIAYNASKAAAHIMTLQMARELTKRLSITVFGIAPAHIAGTGMSAQIEKEVGRVRGWTAEYAREYQRKGSVTGESLDVHELAEFIAYLLRHKQRHQPLSGCILPYGA
jgi:NAD(P)-dependent dehydrogenase (short-subunit alcohol dehydrogenase family)